MFMLQSPGRMQKFGFILSRVYLITTVLTREKCGRYWK
jgi:hypothetical protein